MVNEDQVELIYGDSAQQIPDPKIVNAQNLKGYDNQNKTNVKELQVD